MIVIPFSSDLIIPILLVLLGFSLLLKALLCIDIPLVRIALGVGFILWGLSYFIDIRFAKQSSSHKKGKSYTVTIDIDKDDHNTQ